MLVSSPLLTDVHRSTRMHFALSFVIQGPRGSLYFDAMLEYVHMDGKWFYLKKDNSRYYLAPGDEVPHINKQIWDGKIGVWPFVTYEPAQRASKNRDKGALELKTYTVDRKIYRACLINSVLPTIKRKFEDVQHE
ncbi:hypothetical protein ATCC90586_001344 [Pythium insidiosum]|nr:hypothetical protein ATCC90586_001344 [Pythium insidiosum]